MGKLTITDALKQVQSLAPGARLTRITNNVPMLKQGTRTICFFYKTQTWRGMTEFGEGKEQRAQTFSSAEGAAAFLKLDETEQTNVAT